MARLPLTNSVRQGRQRPERRGDARSIHPRVDRLGGLLGVRFRLLEPQGNCQSPARDGLGGHAARRRSGSGRTHRFRRTVVWRLHFRERVASFRTQQNRKLELKTAEHLYQVPGRYTVAVKVIDIFGNDTMTLVPVNVG